MTEDYFRVETGRGEILIIPRIVKSYEVKEVIGTGGFGVVVSLVDRNTKDLMAAKIMKRPEPSTDSMRLIERELRLSLSLSCPFLVNCVDVVYLSDIICIIMEHVNGATLISVMDDNVVLVRHYWRKIFVQMCLAVQYLHKRGMAHRDIKLENIIVDKDFNVKLCDYGCMKETGQSSMSTTLCGTLPYLAPELVRQGPYCAKGVDVWALGITLYAAVTGVFPWDNTSVVGMCKEILGGVKDVMRLSSEVKEVVMKCCEVDPSKRAGIGDVLGIPFLERAKIECLGLGEKVGLGLLQVKSVNRKTPTRSILRQLILSPVVRCVSRRVRIESHPLDQRPSDPPRANRLLCSK